MVTPKLGLSGAKMGRSRRHLSDKSLPCFFPDVGKKQGGPLGGAGMSQKLQTSRCAAVAADELALLPAIHYGFPAIHYSDFAHFQCSKF